VISVQLALLKVELALLEIAFNIARTEMIARPVAPPALI
jgi:hypothetical protein